MEFSQRYSKARNFNDFYFEILDTPSPLREAWLGQRYSFEYFSKN